MSKAEATKRIKQILAKDTRFNNAEIKVTFKAKSTCKDRV